MGGTQLHGGLGELLKWELDKGHVSKPWKVVGLVTGNLLLFHNRYPGAFALALLHFSNNAHTVSLRAFCIPLFLRRRESMST